MARRPPNTMAEMGTPSPFSNSLLMQGQFLAGAVDVYKRQLLDCAERSAALDARMEAIYKSVEQGNNKDCSE